MAIFVNYRRDDSLAITGRIDDHLRREFGEDAVYRDIDSISPGVDFVEHIEGELEKCDVVVAVIDPGWITDRLLNENDFVRIELETAIRRKIMVIPVLVEGATLPNSNQLPEGLKPLVRRQALHLDAGRDFRGHVQRLVNGIREARIRSEAAANAERLRLEADRAATHELEQKSHLAAAATREQRLRDRQWEEWSARRDLRARQSRAAFYRLLLVACVAVVVVALALHSGK